MIFRTGLSLACALALFLVAGCGDTETNRMGERGPGERAPADPETRPGQDDPTTTPGTNNPAGPGQSADSDPTPNTNESANGEGTGAGTGQRGTNPSPGNPSPGGTNTQNR